MRPLIPLVLLFAVAGCKRDVVGACTQAITAQNACYAQAYDGASDSGLGSYADADITAQVCAIVDSIRMGRGQLVKSYECQTATYASADCSTPKGYDAAETQALLGCL